MEVVAVVLHLVVEVVGNHLLLLCHLAMVNPQVDLHVTKMQLLVNTRLRLTPKVEEVDLHLVLAVVLVDLV